MSKTFKILKYEIRSDGMKTILFSDKDLKRTKKLPKRICKTRFQEGSIHSL